jgi:hypothetical protein
MKVDVRNLDMYQDDEDQMEMFQPKEKTKKKNVRDEFRKQNNKKLNKPKRPITLE